MELDMTPRWDPYFLRGGALFDSFWAEHLSDADRRLLFVLGKGFDPRMTKGIERVLAQSSRVQCDCIMIEFDEGPDSPSIGYREQVFVNMARTQEVIAPFGQLLPRSVPMWESAGSSRRRVGARNATRIFTNILDFANYTDVIVDVSSLPRSLYFPLLGGTLSLLDGYSSKFKTPNLHVLVCENHKLDGSIRDIGVDDDAAYLPGFAADLEAESYRDIPTIWFPVLGETQRVKLQRLYELIDPNEIVLVLPWPSVNPRRADSLIGEYHDLLFDQWRIEPSNVLYAPERNPFEAYRQIRQAAVGYSKALKPLGGCKTAISAGSSKLLSLGALLAAYELRKLSLPVGLAHVEAKGYLIPDDFRVSELEQQNELFSLWLFGECYEA